MSVRAPPFGSDLAGVEESLFLLPGVDVYQGFMGAGLFGAFAADDTDVLGIAYGLEEP